MDKEIIYAVGRSVLAVVLTVGAMAGIGGAFFYQPEQLQYMSNILLVVIGVDYVLLGINQTTTGSPMPTGSMIKKGVKKVDS